MAVELFDIDQGYAIFSKGDYQTKKHAHYAIEVVCCNEGSFDIVTNVAEFSNIQSVVIPSNLPHRFSCLKARCNLLFLDPLSAPGRYFLQQYHLASQKSIVVNPCGLNRFHKNGEFDISLLLDCAKTNRARELDFRISACIQTINTSLTDDKLSLAELSRASFLSESRLAHLFKQELGISVRQCILWKKILLAVLKSREGYSLTESAHYAGFSDSSHLNKVFFKMFGVNPFFVLKD